VITNTLSKEIKRVDVSAPFTLPINFPPDNKRPSSKRSPYCNKHNNQNQAVSDPIQEIRKLLLMFFSGSESAVMIE
jgi:hypothetical protein